MSSSYTIGQLAKAVGVPATTVRFYERKGILQADQRSEGNYRIYNKSTLERLRFILAAKASGFTLSDVSALLKFRDGYVAPCKEVQGLIEIRLADVKKRIKEAGRIEKILQSLRRTCIRSEKKNRCGVMGKLKKS